MAGRYRAYNNYKSSDVQWLGGIPELWKITQIKHIGRLKGGAGFPHIEQGVSGEDLDVHKVNALGSADDKGILQSSENTISVDTASRLGAFIFPVNSIVFAKAGAALLLSRIRLVGTPACIDNNMMGLVVNDQNNFNFIRYAMCLVRFDYLVNPGAIPSLNEFQMGNSFLAIPSIEEQKQIANFLDHETAKIDTLIDKQQQLIKLLKEKRQAVISHAVTKGLNPAAPMKDSGVEWLGEVPEGWVVARAKHVADIFVPQRNKPELNESEGVFWATMEDMKTERIVATSNFVSELAAKVAGSKTLKRGSVIASCVGNFGVASVNDVDVIINQQLQAFIPLGIEAEYLRLQVTISKAYFEIVGTAATLIYVNQEGFENLPVIVPPIKEQKDIVAAVTLRSDKFMNLIFKAELAISLMQERRTALISAAVTGKIDVRNCQPAG